MGMKDWVITGVTRGAGKSYMYHVDVLPVVQHIAAKFQVCAAFGCMRAVGLPGNECQEVRLCRNCQVMSKDA